MSLRNLVVERHTPIDNVKGAIELLKSAEPDLAALYQDPYDHWFKRKTNQAIWALLEANKKEVNCPDREKLLLDAHGRLLAIHEALVSNGNDLAVTVMEVMNKLPCPDGKMPIEDLRESLVRIKEALSFFANGGIPHCAWHESHTKDDRRELLNAAIICVDHSLGSESRECCLKFCDDALKNIEQLAGELEKEFCKCSVTNLNLVRRAIERLR